MAAGNATLAFYACFVDEGVLLVPRGSYQNSPDLIESFQQTIAMLKPQLKTDLEVGVLLNAGHRKGYAKKANLQFITKFIYL